MLFYWRGTAKKPAPSLVALPVLTAETLFDTTPFGVWPENLDEVPGWVIEREARWGRLPTRTRRQFEEQVARLEEAFQPKDHTPLPAYSPQEAAQIFYEWLPSGSYESTELSDIYRRHCEAMQRVPASENHMREAFGSLPGVTRKMLSKKDAKGKRIRPIFWMIDKAVEPYQVAA